MGESDKLHHTQRLRPAFRINPRLFKLGGGTDAFEAVAQGFASLLEGMFDHLAKSFKFTGIQGVLTMWSQSNKTGIHLGCGIKRVWGDIQ